MTSNQTGTPDEGGTGKAEDTSSLSEAELASRFDQLSRQLQAHGQAEETARRANSGDTTGYARAVKLGSEFIAGIVVGAGLGWFIDRWLGTLPWGLIFFLMVGFGAGVLNVMRSEGMVTQAGIRSAEKSQNQGDKSSGDR